MIDLVTRESLYYTYHPDSVTHLHLDCWKGMIDQIELKLHLTHRYEMSIKSARD